MIFFEALFIVVLGLIVGSFIGAFTYRFPRRISIIKGRSICPRCKNKISWYDNIPVISFLLLGGRCRECSGKISSRYPLTELTTSFGFFTIWYFFRSEGVWTIAYLFSIYLILSSIFVIDIEERIIPDELVFSGFFLSFVYLLGFNQPLYINLLTGFLLSFFLLAIHFVTKGKGMGLGDVKFALFPGFFFGFPLGLIWIFLAFLTGAAVGIILIATGKASFGKQIAFGPFLVISFALTLFFGSKLLTIIWF